MSAIPPNWAASVIQSTGAVGRITDDQKKERAQADQISKGEFSKHLLDMIESGERDSQVFEDAEGKGGQGRADGQHEPHGHEVDEVQDEPPAASGGLDVSA